MKRAVCPELWGPGLFRDSPGQICSEKKVGLLFSYEDSLDQEIHSLLPLFRPHIYIYIYIYINLSYYTKALEKKICILYFC